MEKEERLYKADIEDKILKLEEEIYCLEEELHLLESELCRAQLQLQLLEDEEQ